MQVPHFVADSWLAAMDAAEDGSEVELGRVSLAQVCWCEQRCTAIEPDSGLAGATAAHAHAELRPN